MKPWVLFITCLRALVRNPMRAVLTILGIVIGIAAVVAIREIGEGSKEQISSQVASLGADVVNVWGASVNTTGVNSGKGGRASLQKEQNPRFARNCRAYRNPRHDISGEDSRTAHGGAGIAEA